jgi:hypothetical protein
VLVGVLTPSAGSASADAAPPCDELEVVYSLAGNLELTETPMGQGDGVYRIGPGTAVVRFDARNGVPTGPARLISYGMTDRFMVHSTTLFWNTHVTTEARTSVGQDACGIAATGFLSDSGRMLEWRSDIRAARTDGTITCEGSLCGKFGAPRAGKSEIHVPPHDTAFRPWVFAPDKRTFTMAKSLMSRSESPKQTSSLALSGREIRRQCVKVDACYP